MSTKQSTCCLNQFELGFLWFGVKSILTHPLSMNQFYLEILELAFLLLFLFYLFFWLCCMACGILVPRPRIEPVPPAVEAWSPNHWTARKFPDLAFLFLSQVALNTEW